MRTTQLVRCTRLVGRGIKNALDGLSKMIGRDVEIRSFEVGRTPATAIPGLLGSLEEQMVGIYLGADGTVGGRVLLADGHIMLMCDPGTAHTLVDLLVGEPADEADSFGEMELSALGEMGNVVGSLFLNSLANDIGMALRHSPPAVKIDMASALLDVIAAEVLQTRDEAFVVETVFRASDCDVAGEFIVVPSRDLLSGLMGVES